MAASCPKCKSSELVPALSENSCSLEPNAGGSVLCCEECNGMWLSHSLVECVVDSGADLGLDDADDTSAEDSVDKRTGLCPLGHGILIRARVHLEDPFFLERCPHCGGIWFDSGEWRQLASSHLLRHLQDFWTPTWRRQRRESAIRDAYVTSLRVDLGDELYEALSKLADTLRRHPHRERALAFLQSAVVEDD